MRSLLKADIHFDVVRRAGRLPTREGLVTVFKAKSLGNRTPQIPAGAGARTHGSHTSHRTTWRANLNMALPIMSVNMMAVAELSFALFSFFLTAHLVPLPHSVVPSLWGSILVSASAHHAMLPSHHLPLLPFSLPASQVRSNGAQRHVSSSIVEPRISHEQTHISSWLEGPRFNLVPSSSLTEPLLR